MSEPHPELVNTLRRACISVACLVLLFSGCRAQNKAARPFTASVSLSSTVIPPHSGKLYVSGNHIRVEWGEVAEVFDLETREGWRTVASNKVYVPLGSKDLSTYAPEMENGSPCPHATYPSSCKLVGSEVVEGRAAKKWDLYNPEKGFHVYYWTDEAQSITLRMEIGDAATYNLSNIKVVKVPDSVFELPKGFTKVDKQFRPIEHE